MAFAIHVVSLDAPATAFRSQSIYRERERPQLQCEVAGSYLVPTEYWWPLLSVPEMMGTALPEGRLASMVTANCLELRESDLIKHVDQ